MHFHVADLRTLPMANPVNLAVASWSRVPVKSENETWYPDGSSGGPWREEVDAALAELDPDRRSRRHSHSLRDDGHGG